MKPVELDATRRRLSACHDIVDLRATGRRLTPRPVFDYVDGGADEELSLRGNTKAFRRWRFQPRALVDVSEVDTSAAFLGSVTPLPLALAPTGYTRMMHPAGEIGAARAAQRHGLPYTLSTMATTTIEAVAEAAAGARRLAAMRAEMVSGLRSAGVDPVDGRAPFVLFTVDDAELTRKHLHARGIAVRRCDTFVGLDDRYLRAAVRPEWPRLVEAIVDIAESGVLR